MTGQISDLMFQIIAKDQTRAAFDAAGKHADDFARRAESAGRKAATGMRPAEVQVGQLGAQFSDIGVQLAGGQSPFLVALQQGSQITHAFGNSGVKGALVGVGQALLSMVNPLSLITIGAIAAGGYLVQMFMQAEQASKRSEEALKGFDALVDRIGKTSAEAGEKIKKGLAQPETWATLKADIAEAERQLSGAFASALDEISAKLDGTQTEGFKAQFLSMQNPIEQTKAAIARLGTELDNGKMSASEVLAELDKMATAKTTPASLYDTIAALRESIKLAVSLKSRLDLLGSVAEPAEKTGRLGSTPESRLREYAAQQKADAELLKRMGIYPTDDLAAKLASQAASLRSASSTSAGAAKVDPYLKIVEGADRRLATLRAEQQAVGLSAEAAARLKNEQDMLNQADQAGIQLAPQQIQLLRAKAEEMARLETSTKSLQENLALATDASSGFLSTMRQGLVAGEGWINSLGNAALSVVDKLASALETKLAEQLVGGLGGMLGGAFSPTTTLSSFLGLPQHAGGTMYAPGGLSLVGERGPELVQLPRGSKVIPNHRINETTASNQNGKIDIGVSIDGEGNLHAYVKKVAMASAVSAATGVVKRYDAQMPDRVRGIARDPRRK